MKDRLARAVARTTESGRVDRVEPVDPRFQGPDEPYPRHWRRFPASWPADAARDPALGERVAAAVAVLPETWRAVLLAPDADHRPAALVAAELGLTVAQQRRIIGLARAAVRDAVAEQLDPDADR